MDTELKPGWLRRAIDLAKTVKRIPTPEEYAEGLALLKELVDGPDAGFTEGLEEGTQCPYCFPLWHIEYDEHYAIAREWDEHEPDCPIQRAREYLKRIEGDTGR